MIPDIGEHPGLRGDTITLGAGAIGLSTAYYLALALKETVPHFISRPSIVVVEPSHNVCPGASGEFTETSSLGVLSYCLHEELASKFRGRNRYGFSNLTIYRISPKNFTASPSPANDWGPYPPINKSVANLPKWTSSSDDWTVQLLADAPHLAHLEPRQFCHFLRKRCEKLGMKFLFNSSVDSLERDDGSEGFTRASNITTKPKEATTTMSCSAAILAAGPWSDRVFSSLFPAARIKIPMNVTYSAGNHLEIRTPSWKPSDDYNSADQVFLNHIIQGPHELDISTFLGGTMYIGGYGATPEALPAYADAVFVQPDALPGMIELARKYLRLQTDETFEVVKSGRCYRPLLIPNNPIITKVKWSSLGAIGSHSSSNTAMENAKHTGNSMCSKPHVIRGFYINTGHDGDGMTLGPGSGKLMNRVRKTRKFQRSKFDRVECVQARRRLGSRC
ncbi:hypothetical protein BU16DRAFT_573004 [Lophium mytilinum]|uniref:FAD dependent oxidoreductase domain-containing protein n=1 Tax=Lophium mytilinum TaxID=390894 RepID=A0A6A6QS00_9PEZI|nr:hypothetical protein BU16DRAFT_573004 [Lophium mytilinum]